MQPSGGVLTRGRLEEILATTRTASDGFTDYTPHRYESPIEERFAWNLTKILPPVPASLVPQYWIDTRIGSFRPDFLLHTPGKITVIECDGGSHQGQHYLDWARDAALLETGYVDQVIRFEGGLINLAPDEAVYAISVVHPEAFDARSLRIAQQGHGPAYADLHEFFYGTHRLIEIPFEIGGGDEDGEPIYKTHVGNITWHTLQMRHKEGSHIRLMAQFLRSGRAKTREEMIDLYKDRSNWTLEDWERPFG